MSLLDQETAENAEYKFMSSGISGFMDEIQQPKQRQNISEDIYDDFPTDTEDTPDENAGGLPGKLQASASVARESAKILTTALDSSMSGIFGFIAKGEASDFKADAEQREELETAFAAYIKLKGGDIPSGVALLLLVISIYGSKGAMAIQMRKVNAEKEALTRRAENAEKELERLKSQMEASKE
ncbi:MAG: hypothetical protein LBS07_05470 [Prevotellaceae bacterium]|jgi:hypothetical protein|nr:hypothetical protein [Prevotellaceae bacterium]